MDVNASIFSFCFVRMLLEYIRMKKQLIIVSILGLLGTTGAIIASSANKVWKGVEAYDATTSLPTTIDLNDSTNEEIKQYYGSLANLSSKELKGNNLLKNLKPILKNNQTYYSYDYEYGTVVWQMYEIADRDWNKSPASAISGYNSSTNTINDYVYGSSVNYDKGTNPYLHALYVNRNVDNQVRAWDDHTQTNWGINREHIWAKSHGFGATDNTYASGGARGDLMHLWPGNGYVNGFDYHGNLFFGFVNKNNSYSDAGNTYSYLSGNLNGTSASLGGGEVFEPQDSDKGDIARAIFYMAARYNYISGSDSDGIDANNPWLTIVDSTSDSNGSSSYDATTTKVGQMGILRDLLAWNRLDPPDEWEIHRNNLLYKNYTHNRNPFIDYPEWAEYIWGYSKLANDQRSVTSYSNIPTDHVKFNSDVINGFKGTGITYVYDIDLDETSLSLKTGQTSQLHVLVHPSTAENYTVTWSSNNNNIATVSNTGLVSAVGAGNTSIKVSVKDHRGVTFSTTCSVTVTEAPSYTYTLTNDSPFINGIPYKLFFYSTSLSKNLYFTGSTSGYYGGVTDSLSSAADVYFEESGDGQNIYCGSGSNKQYLSVYKNGNYFNYKYDTNVPSEKWHYSSTYNCMAINADGTPCTLGSYSTNERLAGHSLSQYPNNYRMDFITSGENGPLGFAQVFLASITCDGVGLSAPTFASNVSWALLQTVYSKLNSENKNTLKNANPNEFGTQVEQAMIRYDLLCRKYTQFNNFIERSSANPSNSVSNLIYKSLFGDKALVIALSIVSGVIIAGAIVLISLKKKKVI